MNVFGSTSILLPREADMEKWAVIACDQFTSQPDYWEAVESKVGDAPSALSMIFPEVWLGSESELRIQNIQAAMRKAVQEKLFTAYSDAYVFVERTLLDGSIRPGLVGAVDLEAYDYRPDAVSPIRATEKTVVERIPPRMKIRSGAALELSHVLLLCNDDQRDLIEPFAAVRDTLPRLYDFDLMQDGGHITGWLVQGDEARAFEQRLSAYTARMARAQGCAEEQALLFAVGDGNHSLATAKECYESLKKSHSGEDLSAHPARFAMVELGNIYDESLKFEPIHRVIKNTDPEALLTAMKSICAPDGEPLAWISGETRGTLNLNCQGRLPVAVLQEFLDAYLGVHPGETDYIHDDTVLEMLAQAEHSIGFLLPPIAKDTLFPGIVSGGVLPRKTFSMGHAREKRYYLEARLIL